jgi:hypothetical protein
LGSNDRHYGRNDYLLQKEKMDVMRPT